MGLDGGVISEVERERVAHGAAWGALLGGYFASAEVAEPLVRVLREAGRASRPDAVVDLGGGTGFVLSLFAETAESEGIELVDLDVSEGQLAEARHPRVRRVSARSEAFGRSDVASSGDRLLFLSRSTLHYFGMNGLRPVLERISDNMEPGECFIHQTACFDSPEEALAMNMLYEMMGTGKWYPTVRKLVEMCLDVGFSLENVEDAPILNLDSDSLAKRYSLSPAVVADISAAMRGFDVGAGGIFEDRGDGSFVARLRYKIFVCRKEG
jgi:SAM-dependent methyltransferase